MKEGCEMFSYGALGKVAVVGSAPAMSDFHKWLHPEISIAGAPMPLGKLDNEGLLNMRTELGGLYEIMAKYEKPQLAFFSCTSGSLVGGKGYDEDLCIMIADKANTKQAFTTSTAIQAALQCLQVKRMSIITPYPDEVNQAEKEFFESNGYVVDSIASIPTPDPSDRSMIYKITPQQIIKFALECTDPESQACFISCTGLRALPVIAELEQKLKKPVLTSNQAAIWMIGHFFGKHHPDAQQHLGQLFKCTL